MSVNSDINKICSNLTRMYEQTPFHEETKLDSFNRLLDQIEQLIEDEKQNREGA